MAVALWLGLIDSGINVVAGYYIISIVTGYSSWEEIIFLFCQVFVSVI